MKKNILILTMLLVLALSLVGCRTSDTASTAVPPEAPKQPPASSEIQTPTEPSNPPKSDAYVVQLSEGQNIDAWLNERGVELVHDAGKTACLEYNLPGGIQVRASSGLGYMMERTAEFCVTSIIIDRPISENEYEETIISAFLISLPADLHVTMRDAGTDRTYDLSIGGGGSAGKGGTWPNQTSVLTVIENILNGREPEEGLFIERKAVFIVNAAMPEYGAGIKYIDPYGFPSERHDHPIDNYVVVSDWTNPEAP
jgi:hypothetical protein